MSTKTRPIQGKCGRIAVLLALTPMMLLNASQAMTLCVGRDGHVAIELVVQDHCACDTPASGPGSARADGAAHLADGPCWLCTDFAVPVAAHNGRTAPLSAKAISSGLGAMPPLSAPALLDTGESTAPQAAQAFLSFYTPLGNILLRV